MPVELLGAMLQLHDLLLIGAVGVAVALTVDGKFSYLSDYLPDQWQLSWLPRIALSTGLLVVTVTYWIYTEGGLETIIREFAFSLFSALVIAAVVGAVIRRGR